MGGLTRTLTGTGGSSSAGGSSAVNTSRTITATGTPAGGTVAVVAGQTLRFTYTAVSGITQCGIQLMNGSSQVGYIALSDGDGQLFVVPGGMSALGFSVDTLVGSGSLTLNIAST